MIFKRKIYDKLLEWKNSPIQNSALLIEGARRIGKSTVAKEFGIHEFDDYLLVDFRNESDEVKSLFNDTKDLDKFFRNFFLSQGKSLKPGSLIIFDEIQFCPKAREAIKDFVADGRYRYIETGSLISIKENTKNIMIPSEERRIDMYPMDFEEFLWAIESNNTYPLLRESLQNHNKINDAAHKKYLENFKTYMLIGGMPKVLSIFLETNSFKLAQEEQMDILKLYEDDLRKHDNQYGTMCLNIFNSIPSQLAKERKRFIISKALPKKRFEQMENSLNDLCDFHIVTKVNCLDSLESPSTLHIENERFKLYFCDIGLLTAKLIPLNGKDVGMTYLHFIKGSASLNLGALYESVTCQELKTMFGDLYYHKFTMVKDDKKKTYELDFVFEKNFKVNILEIKSSKHYTTSSLDNIKKKYPQIKTDKYVFGIKNASYQNDKTTYPIYAIECL